MKAGCKLVLRRRGPFYAGHPKQELGGQQNEVGGPDVNQREHDVVERALAEELGLTDITDPDELRSLVSAKMAEMNALDPRSEATSDRENRHHLRFKCPQNCRAQRLRRSRDAFPPLSPCGPRVHDKRGDANGVR